MLVRQCQEGCRAVGRYLLHGRATGAIMAGMSNNKRDMTLSEYGRWRSEQRPLVERECQQCSTAFAARDARARYCSRRCSKRAERARKRQQQQQTPQ